MTSYTEEEQERTCHIKNSHQNEVEVGDSAAIDIIRKFAEVDFLCWAKSDLPDSLVPRGPRLQTDTGSVLLSQRRSSCVEEEKI